MESNIWLTIINVVIVVFGLGVSIYNIQNTKRKNRAEYNHALQLSWSQFNLAVLDNDEHLRIADWLSSYDAKPLTGVNPIRCKYIAYLKLNAINLAFLADMDKVGDTSYASRTINQLLPSLLIKKELFELTQTRGYSPAFAKKCLEMQKNPSPETLAGIENHKKNLELALNLEPKSLSKVGKSNEKKSGKKSR